MDILPLPGGEDTGEGVEGFLHLTLLDFARITMYGILCCCRCFPDLFDGRRSRT